MSNNLPVKQEKKLPENLPIAKLLGEVNLNGFKITCAILEDGRRVFSERSLANAFGIRGSGAFYEKKREGKTVSAFLPEYLSANYLSPFITNELKEKFKSAFSYISTNKMIATGVDATVLTDICDVYITAAKSGKIKNKNFLMIAENAYIMLKAFANEGILRVIDRTLGYKYDKEKVIIETILKLFVSPDILEWQRTFHLGFYREIFRLWNVPFTEQYIKRKPSFIGTLTNSFVYNNLPKGSFVLAKLKEKTPKTKGGNYKVRLFQSLTPLGKEELKKIINSVETIATISENQTQFKQLMEKRYNPSKQIKLIFPEYNENETETKKIESPTTFDKTLKALMTVPKPEK